MYLLNFFKNYFDKKKDWRFNRIKLELTSFIAYHHIDTSLNILFDRLALYLNNDFSSFDDFDPSGLTPDLLKQGFDVENYIAEIRKRHPTLGVSFVDSSKRSNIRDGSVWRYNYQNRKLTAIAFQYLSQSHGTNMFSLVNPDTLYFAYYAENDYIDWQSNNGVVANYKYRGGLKYTKNKQGQKSIDISDRPGRMVFTKYFNYCGASQMWFGPLIYRYIPQELILEFEGAIEIKIIDNNITFVHLYDGVYEGDEPNNQEIQKRFREHIKIDEINIED